ncbi:glutamine--fructose-6-phosphate aminotransferase, partial [Wenyingzhuangia sp. 1_MG-2023]|nr:glutamine--fructose-6-phosphate aminotransferase [Wenyingzhuangia sp. 1_MG-2023]
GLGIAHTRWATHGEPSEANAHPHISGDIAVVHNGIIENHASLRRELEADGYHFESQTDTEVIAHLIARAVTSGESLLAAVKQVRQRLEGAYGMVAVNRATP